MNREWVKTQLDRLDRAVNATDHKPPLCLTTAQHELLNSPEEDDINKVLKSMVDYLGLRGVFMLTFEWGIMGTPEIGGTVRSEGVIHHIKVPFHSLGKPYMLGAILCHEISHVYLSTRGLELLNLNENEMLTDLASIYNGLAKPVLNGRFSEEDIPLGSTRSLGYLPNDLMLYAYKWYCDRHSISSLRGNDGLIKKVSL